MKYFIFNCVVKTESYTVIFDSQRLLSEDDLTAQLKDFHRNNNRCSNVFYIYPERKQESSEVADIVSSAANVTIEEVILAPYNETGLITTNDLTAAVLLYGNVEIIKRHSAILESDNNYHYVNPSGKHTPFFIRTGNILAKNEEINFIAFQILKYLKEDSLPEIACDTASIIAIPYAISQILDLFDKKFTIPIRSFGSYRNLKDYTFKKGSMVLLSASNSGNLEDEVLAIESDLISITIILNCNHIVNSQGRKRNYIVNIHTLFDTLVSNNCAIEHYKADNCKYCHENSIPVYVHGDQFIPSKIIVQEVLIRKHHKAPTLNKVIEDFTGSKSIIAYRGETVNEKIREIFIDMKNLLKNPQGGFFKKYQGLLKNEIPSSISLIVTLEDQSSLALAKDIHSYLSIALKRQLPSPVVQRDLDGLHNSCDIENILVVAASISTGNLLNSISRTLRKFKNSSIHYLIVFARLNDADKLKLLSNNLRSRQGTDEQNHVHVLYECPMPNHHTELLTSYQRGPWWNEGIFLQNIVDKHPEYYDLLKGRLSDLAASGGMLNNLFLPNAFNGTALSLRPNFAFYDFGSTTPSQADVYFIFLQIFHSLRNPNILQRKERDDKFFIHHEHVKSVVSPENFTRFNDGIIQACLLRIASPIELDYTSSEEISLLMLNKLKIILQKDDLESSEAILEFLLAIASKKMKLLDAHIGEFYEHMKGQFSGYNFIDMFLATIKETNIL